MRASIFRNSNEKSIRSISTVGDWFLTLRFFSDDPDWIRTRFSGRDGEFVEACGISSIPGDLKARCYNSGGFWDHKYDSFDWRSETIHPKGLGGISHNPYY